MAANTNTTNSTANTPYHEDTEMTPAPDEQPSLAQQQHDNRAFNNNNNNNSVPYPQSPVPNEFDIMMHEPESEVLWAVANNGLINTHRNGSTSSLLSSSSSTSTSAATMFNNGYRNHPPTPHTLSNSRLNQSSSSIGSSTGSLKGDPTRMPTISQVCLTAPAGSIGVGGALPFGAVGLPSNTSTMAGSRDSNSSKKMNPRNSRSMSSTRSGGSGSSASASHSAAAAAAVASASGGNVHSPVTPTLWDQVRTLQSIHPIQDEDEGVYEDDEDEEEEAPVVDGEDALVSGQGANDRRILDSEQTMEGVDAQQQQQQYDLSATHHPPDYQQQLQPQVDPSMGSDPTGAKIDIQAEPPPLNDSTGSNHSGSRRHSAVNPYFTLSSMSWSRPGDNSRETAGSGSGGGWIAPQNRSPEKPSLDYTVSDTPKSPMQQMIQPEGGTPLPEGISGHEGLRGAGGSSTSGAESDMDEPSLEELIEAKDWSKTSVGARETWSHELESYVQLLMRSASPLGLYWGDDHSLIYNDAWRPILKKKHPRSLGAPAAAVWSEIWDVLGPQMAHVRSSKRGNDNKGLRLELHRQGYEEECYFDFTYTPIFLHDGTLGGIFAFVLEVTQPTLDQRRLKTLNHLSRHASLTQSIDGAYSTLTTILQESNNVDTPFSLIYTATDPTEVLPTAYPTTYEPMLSATTHHHSHSSSRLSSPNPAGSVYEESISPLTRRRIPQLATLVSTSYDRNLKTVTYFSGIQETIFDPATSTRNIPDILLLTPETYQPISPDEPLEDDPWAWPIQSVLSDGIPRLVNLPKAKQRLARAMVLPVLDNPSIPDSRITTVLVIGLNPHRMLDNQYLDFMALIVANVSSFLHFAKSREDERKTSEALKELNNAKISFFQNISHELRTPLTLMLGPLEEVLEVTQGSELHKEIRPNLEMVYRNSRRMLKLVNTLLQFSRIEAGRGDATFEETDLSKLTREISASYESVARGFSLDFKIQCDDDALVKVPGGTWVDPNMWGGIVLNLLGNAFKHTWEGGVSVRLYPCKDRKGTNGVALDVADTGVGIAAEDLPSLFGRFNRIENKQSRSHEGTGIGLSLVKELIEIHKGTVSVTSELDKGTTFHLWLPAGTDHLPVSQLKGRDPSGSGGAEGSANKAKQSSLVARNQNMNNETDASMYVEEATQWISHNNKSPVAKRKHFTHRLHSHTPVASSPSSYATGIIGNNGSPHDAHRNHLAVTRPHNMAKAIMAAASSGNDSIEDQDDTTAESGGVPNKNCYSPRMPIVENVGYEVSRLDFGDGDRTKMLMDPTLIGDIYVPEIPAFSKPPRSRRVSGAGVSEQSGALAGSPDNGPGGNSSSTEMVSQSTTYTLSKGASFRFHSRSNSRVQQPIMGSEFSGGENTVTKSCGSPARPSSPLAGSSSGVVINNSSNIGGDSGTGKLLPGSKQMTIEETYRSTRPMVIVADDNKDMRSYLREILGKEFRVRCAEDGADALKIITERLNLGKRVDLVLSDVAMPNMNGYELLQHLRSDSRTISTPFIFLSARAGEESSVEGLERGADDCLVKPFSSRELLARVRASIRLADIRHQLVREQRYVLEMKQLIYSISARIQSGLSLPEILDTASHELFKVIGCNAVRICRVRRKDDNTGQHVVRFVSEVVRVGLAKVSSKRDYMLPKGLEFEDDPKHDLDNFEQQGDSPQHHHHHHQHHHHHHRNRHETSDSDLGSDVGSSGTGGHPLQLSGLKVLLNCRQEGHGHKHFLSVGLYYNQKVWGYLLACRDGDRDDWTPSEKVLFEQTGNQISLAITHASLWELKKAQQVEMEAAHAANEAKSQILANTSHELRTPIGAIIGALSALEDTDFNLTGEQRDMVKIMQITSEVALSVINDLLDTAKLEAGAMTLCVKECRMIAETLEQSLRVFADKSGRKEVDLVLEPMESLLRLEHEGTIETDSFGSMMTATEKATMQRGSIWTDSDRLQQVVMNLIGNAIKFTSVGKVVIQCTVQKSEPTASLGNLVQQSALNAALAASGSSTGTSADDTGSSSSVPSMAMVLEDSLMKDSSYPAPAQSGPTTVNNNTTVMGQIPANSKVTHYMLRFEVTDTGIGIDPEFLKNHIFKSFAQFDQTMTRRFGGTGLGLAISKHLVMMNGGVLGVTSTVGVGSTFYFTWPMLYVEPDTAPMAATSSQLNTHTPSITEIPTYLRDSSPSTRLRLSEEIASSARAIVVEPVPEARHLLSWILNEQALSVTTYDSFSEQIVRDEAERNTCLLGPDGRVLSKNYRPNGFFFFCLKSTTMEAVVRVGKQLGELYLRRRKQHQDEEMTKKFQFPSHLQPDAYDQHHQHQQPQPSPQGQQPYKCTIIFVVYSSHQGRNFAKEAAKRVRSNGLEQVIVCKYVVKPVKVERVIECLEQSGGDLQELANSSRSKSASASRRQSRRSSLVASGSGSGLVSGDGGSQGGSTLSGRRSSLSSRSPFQRYGASMSQDWDHHSVSEDQHHEESGILIPVPPDFIQASGLSLSDSDGSNDGHEDDDVDDHSPQHEQRQRSGQECNESPERVQGGDYDRDVSCNKNMPLSEAAMDPPYTEIDVMAVPPPSFSPQPPYPYGSSADSSSVEPSPMMDRSLLLNPKARFSPEVQSPVGGVQVVTPHSAVSSDKTEIDGNSKNKSSTTSPGKQPMSLKQHLALKKQLQLKQQQKQLGEGTTSLSNSLLPPPGQSSILSPPAVVVVTEPLASGAEGVTTAGMTKGGGNPAFSCRSARAAAGKRDRKNKCILCVEDNIINLRVVQYQLQKLGYDTRSACDGQVAVDIIKAQVSQLGQFHGQEEEQAEAPLQESPPPTLLVPVKNENDGTIGSFVHRDSLTSTTSSTSTTGSVNVSMGRVNLSQNNSGGPTTAGGTSRVEDVVVATGGRVMAGSESQDTVMASAPTSLTTDDGQRYFPQLQESSLRPSHSTTDHDNKKIVLPTTQSFKVGQQQAVSESIPFGHPHHTHNNKGRNVSMDSSDEDPRFIAQMTNANFSRSFEAGEDSTNNNGGRDNMYSNNNNNNRSPSQNSSSNSGRSTDFSNTSSGHTSPDETFGQASIGNTIVAPNSPSLIGNGGNGGTGTKRKVPMDIDSPPAQRRSTSPTERRAGGLMDVTTVSLDDMMEQDDLPPLAAVATTTAAGIATVGAQDDGSMNWTNTTRDSSSSRTELLVPLTTTTSRVKDWDHRHEHHQYRQEISENRTGDSSGHGQLGHHQLSGTVNDPNSTEMESRDSSRRNSSISIPLTISPARSNSPTSSGATRSSTKSGSGGGSLMDSTSTEQSPRNFGLGVSLGPKSTLLPLSSTRSPPAAVGSTSTTTKTTNVSNARPTAASSSSSSSLTPSGSNNNGGGFGKIDLILMDCAMPVKSGFDAAIEIRAMGLTSEYAAKIPIIALTASAVPSTKERCLASGINGYLSKPTKLADLESMLNQWIQPSD